MGRLILDLCLKRKQSNHLYIEAPDCVVCKTVSQHMQAGTGVFCLQQNVAVFQHQKSKLYIGRCLLLVAGFRIIIRSLCSRRAEVIFWKFLLLNDVCVCFMPYYSGAEIVRKALRIPCYTIASNAGVDAQEVVTKVMAGKQDFGYDAMRGQFVDMMKSGIIDPTKVWMSYSNIYSLIESNNKTR